MRSSWLLIGSLLCLAALLLSPVRAGETVRCGSRIVSLDALAPAVYAACGEPAYRDTWDYFDQSYGRYVADTEVWTYNFGPNQLLRILRFRRGRLRAIETDGYGFYAQADSHCAPEDIVPGLSKYRLALRCGEPAIKDAAGFLFGERPYPRYRGGDRAFSNDYVTPIYREAWTYNFGPRYFLRRVILENGRITEVIDGDRGYATP